MGYANGVDSASAPKDRLGDTVPKRVRVDGKLFVRGGDRFRCRGVTYGPFRPNAYGHQFPDPSKIKKDFAEMVALSINAVRVYHAPPPYVLELASEHGLVVYIDVPWPKHTCFLESENAQRDAFRAVRDAAKVGRTSESTFCYSICNEIPADVVRWHGAGKVETFLGELADHARQFDPDALITYASFPPTEYLQLPFLDFASFNVYLHDPAAFRGYLARLPEFRDFFEPLSQT